MTYKASLDTLAKVITLVFTILLAAIIGGHILIIKEEGKVLSVIASLLLSLIYIGTFLFRPINYSLTNDKLIIRRPLAEITINRQEIKSIEQIGKGKLKGTMRTFGVGGLFGYWGRFTNTKIGSMTWYATRRDNAVLVTTINNRKIVLTPNEPEKLIAEFNGQPS